MSGVGAITLALVCLILGCGLKYPARLPRLEAFWFQACITWPVIVKAAIGSLIFVGDSGTSFTLVTYGPAIAASVFLLVSRVLSHPKVYAPALILFAFPVLAVPFLVFGRGGPVDLLPLLFFAPAVLYPKTTTSLDAWGRSARTGLVLIAASFASVAYTSPANVIGACRLDKCSAFGEVLTSPITNNGNFAGISVALLLSVALLGVRRFSFVLTAAGALLLVELAGSRAAELSAITVTVAFLIAGQSSKRRSFMGKAVLAAGLVGTLITALYPFAQTFATNRGYLWNRARELTGEHPILGWGPFYWGDQGDTTALIANYSPHNFWLELIVSTGFTGAALVVIAGVLLLRSQPPESRYATVLIIGSILLIGVLESPIQPALLGLAPFAHVLPLMIAAGVASAPPTKTEKVRPTRLHQLNDRAGSVLPRPVIRPERRV
ncbi:O-antigen ligase family protein [Arthrobacter sp. NPDC092385]|uniref:O-antigen ligase family protein n=1 Tax=Arthrobacter sp. NPDC092385 TaxID=3363943 RepID=UPI00381D12FB